MNKLALEKSELRRFGLITGAIIVSLFALILPWVFDHSWPIWPWIFAGVLWLAALFIPAGLGPIYLGWMKFGHIVGAFNAKVILSIVFYLLITPVGLVMRFVGKSPIPRGSNKEQTSYRVPSRKPLKNHFERPF